VHKLAVALDFFCAGKILGKDEMQIALQGMTEDNGRLVAVVVNSKRTQV